MTRFREPEETFHSATRFFADYIYVCYLVSMQQYGVVKSHGDLHDQDSKEHDPERDGLPCQGEPLVSSRFRSSVYPTELCLDMYSSSHVSRQRAQEYSNERARVGFQQPELSLVTSI